MIRGFSRTYLDRRAMRICRPLSGRVSIRDRNSSKRRVRWATGRLFAVVIAATMPLTGCLDGPTEFDYHELSFRDSVRAEAVEPRTVVVLQQLRDGPVSEYWNVPHDIAPTAGSSDSLVLILDVEGVSARREPIIFKTTRRRGDTLIVWYADEALEQVAPTSGKTGETVEIFTTPPEEYLKVTHVTISTGADREVEFLHEFLP